MRSAVVNSTTNLVENLIVADPSVDAAPDGYLLVKVTSDRVDIGTPYINGDFVLPPIPATAVVHELPPDQIDGLEML